MHTWNGSQLGSIDEGPILVIGPEGAFTRALAHEIESLPGQALRAVDEADLAVLVTDARAGLTPADEDIARRMAHVIARARGAVDLIWRMR